MTREIAVEYARQGIRANALCPGPDRDPAARGAAVAIPARRARRLVHIPMGRLGQRRGAGQGRAVPRVRRLVVHDRRRARRRRRHHRRVRHARVATSTDLPCADDDVPGCSTRRTLDEADRRRRDRHRARRVPRPPGPARRQAGHRPLLPRPRARRDGIEACNYLLAVDVDMTPLPGYEFANWEQGYGDFAVPPDLVDAAHDPVAREDRARALRPRRRGRPASRSRSRRAASCNARSSAPPTLGFTVKFGVGARVLPVPRVATRRPQAKGYADLTPHSHVIEDYHILQTTRDEYLIRAIRNGIDGAGVPVEFSKGEAGQRPARDQPRVRRRARDGRPPRRSTRTARRRSPAQHGRSITFMAKYSMDESARRATCTRASGTPTATTSLMWDDDGPDHLSPAFRGWLGGQLARTARARVDVRPDRQLLQALPARVVGADRARVGRRQPHVRVPRRRPRPGVPPRVAHPRRRLQPVPRVRGDDRGRPARHRARHRAGAALRRQRVRGAPTSPRVPCNDRRRDRRARDERRSRPRRSAPTCTTTC